MVSGIASLYDFSQYALCSVIYVNVHEGVFWSKFGEMFYTSVR
jgi:hypothetical protein